MDYHLLNSSNLFTNTQNPTLSSTSLLLPCHHHHLSSPSPPPPPLLPQPLRAAATTTPPPNRRRQHLSSHTPVAPPFVSSYRPLPPPPLLFIDILHRTVGTIFTSTMMWSTKSCQFERKPKQIALEVHDDDDDGDDYHRPSDLSDSDRRFSLNHRRSTSPVANGLDSAYSSSETERFGPTLLLQMWSADCRHFTSEKTNSTLMVQSNL
ncbi:hypothetical protein HanLR1_Chr17g0677421 [Helianthus annuus]|nr:hypothetical protein HanLR1_Chr17g0677421 [Helianthus annuus]